jgi:hypothetical protein
MGERNISLKRSGKPRHGLALSEAEGAEYSSVRRNRNDDFENAK